ncbi:sensor histidine kinase [Pontibacter akesuensis]|uniref:histidine kinase n=1 Tax=Pontibacter akesuensis TaxID=388950 RepID=A0A1I7GW43_9BACT|nr:sensor histidine kinase [Pontibacter akesuensis]GHA54794.1 hypothetical protein GCM10007389_02650 [Pontibacter akesuensis]SFU52651.1 Histidine kinase-, DNA gyrase B-, and HSP90-like ATPase [Pontibacter akesuensis]
MQRTILKININNELDVVLAYKRAMQLSERLGMQQANQTKFATAVSEICRNVVEHVGSGGIQFSMLDEVGVNYLEALITDRGRGIGNLPSILASHTFMSGSRGSGISNSRKLVDVFDIQSDSEKGTRVMLRKKLPSLGAAVSKAVLDNWTTEFEEDADISPYAEIKKQNMQLLEVMEKLHLQNLEAEQQLLEIRRLNVQLQQSNQDISQLLEDRDRKNRMLEEINQNLDAFAHTVTHDLRAPLQNIDGISTALEACIQTNHLDEAQVMLPMLRHQTQKMDRLITGILAYSLAGHQSIAKKVLDLQVLVPQVISSLDVPPSITFELADELPILYSQEIYLYQVFSNLIGNAIKYYDKPDQGLIRISFESGKEWLHFSVEDNGPGIPQEVQHQIFFMYEIGKAIPRADSSGLGLSIIRKIIEEKGGKVWVESSGRGSRFSFTWPAQELVNEV